MTDHTHHVDTVVPLDAKMAAAIANPLMLVVYDQRGNVYTWCERLTPGLVGLALAEHAATICRDHPATAEEHEAYSGARE